MGVGGSFIIVTTIASSEGIPVIAVVAYAASATINVFLWYDVTAKHVNNPSKSAYDWFKWGASSAVSFAGLIPMLIIPSAIISIFEQNIWSYIEGKND